MESGEKKIIDQKETPPSMDKRPLEIHGKEKNWKIRFGRLFARFILFSLVVFLVVVVLLAFWIHKYFGPMNLDHPDTDLLNTWLIARDFSKETPEVRQKLLVHYLKYYGPEAVYPSHSKLVGATKKITRHFFNRRLMRVQKWVDSRTLRTFARHEYHVRPQNLSVDRYILPEDIEPTTELETFRNSKAYSPAPPAEMRMELNCRYLVREWFLLKMKIYAGLPDEEKNDFIQKTAKEMEWWQNYYCDALRQMDLPQPGILDLIRELDLTILWWYEATPDSKELARLLWFKDLLISANVANLFGIKFNLPKVSPHSKTKTEDIIRFFINKSIKK